MQLHRDFQAVWIIQAFDSPRQIDPSLRRLRQLAFEQCPAWRGLGRQVGASREGEVNACHRFGACKHSGERSIRSDVIEGIDD
jgi:hypothetical protein